MSDDQQADVDQLTAELAAATSRADALDVRCSAAERLARAVANMPGYEPENLAEADEFVAAMEQWKRAEASHHTTRANDYSEAIQQLADARRWVPTFTAGLQAEIAQKAAGAGQTPGEWIADYMDAHIYESKGYTD